MTAGPPPAGPVVPAAGAVLWRPAPDGDGDGDGDGEVEVALVHRPKYDDWSLPKGKLDPGEHVLECVLRELEEETGHRVALGRPLPVQRYPVPGATKEVRYWLARADDGAAPWRGTAEIDQVDFLPCGLARQRLTHERDAELVRAALAGPRDTVPVIVLRHAHAQSRRAWRGPDAHRPLDALGRRQAYRLARVLRAFAPSRIVCSDAVRCLETVRPYAVEARVAVELDPWVSEAGSQRQPQRAVEIGAALRGATEPTVVCSHRPVLPGLINGVLGPPEAGPTGNRSAQTRLAPGSFLVVHVESGIARAVERHDV